MEKTADLAAQARSGDGDAFRALVDPYRRALQAHCYRMLGSFQDAEDVLQDSLLAAWQGLGAFEGRSSLRTWLFSIATNRCLNARRAARRRPAKAWDVPGVALPDPTGTSEIVWLEPYPDAMLDRDEKLAPTPEGIYEQNEAISLAFVTGLQALPPRQLSVLLLRDVVGFQADEVAGMLETTVDGVNSVLKRARAGLQARLRGGVRREPDTPPAGSPREVAIAARFVTAWQASDLDALVELLTDDVFISMPPMPYVYQGRDAVLRFCASLFGAGRRFELVAVRANGQLAFGVYLRTGGDRRPGVGLYVLGLSGDGICEMTRFESHVLPWFGLPPCLA